MSPLALIGALLLAPEKPFTSPEQLRASATAIVVGDVEDIAVRRVLEGPWDVVRFTARVRVEAVEKGDGLAPGDALEARYWARAAYLLPGEQPGDTAGHEPLPTVGARVRLYAVDRGDNGFGETTDGGWDVYGRNGWEVLEEPATPGPVRVLGDWRRGAAVWIGAGLAAAAAVAVALRRSRARRDEVP